MRRPAAPSPAHAGPGRIRDDGRSLAAFMDRIDVVCPSCGARAVVTMTARSTLSGVSVLPGRLACMRCGASRTQRLPAGTMYSYAFHMDGRDPLFGLPLWLVAETRHGVLFAYNVEHLEALERFVGATLRERHTLSPAMLRNATMHSRLPRWMKLARNRAEVRAGLARLRRRLVSMG